MTRILGRMSVNSYPQFTALLIVTVAWGVARAELPSAEPAFGVLSWDSGGGVPNKSTTAMARTPDGYLWLGTRFGLLRFDGVRFVTITPDTAPALGDNRIRSLVVDRGGVLWIGTEGGTLSRWRAGEFESVPLDPRLHETSIESLTVADEGGIWLGTDKWGLVRVSSGECDFSHSTPGLPREAARSIVRTASGEWWTMTESSLVTLTRGSWQDRQVGLEQGTRLLALAPDCQGMGAWLATTANRLAPRGRGARVFKIEGGKIVRELAPYPWRQDSRYSNITSLIEDGQGRVWVATHLDGVYYWQAEQGWHELRSREQRSYLQINGFHADGEGLLWMAARDGGLHRVTRQEVATMSLPPAQAKEIIISVCTTRDGTLWVATEDAGVFRFHEGRFLQVTSGLPPTTVGPLFEDSQANLWVGTRRGLWRWNGDEFQPVSLGARASAVYAIFEDRAGNLWVGDGPYVVRIHPQGETRIFDDTSGLGNGTVVGVAEDARGRIYVSKESTGLFQLKGDQFESLAGLGAALGASRALWPDEEGGLWIATAGQGLHRLFNDTLTSWAFEDGLPNEYLRSVMPDGAGNLWFNASKGIFGCSIRALLSYQRGRTPSVVFWRLSETDGMAGDWTSGLGQPVASRSSDGRLWFPNRNTVAVIDPEVVTRGRVDHPPLIEEIVVDGTVHPRARDGTLQLLSGARHMQIHYTCPDVQSPGVRRFRYCLEGWNVDWVEAGERRVAYYGPLDPGDFRFRVMVGSQAGEWLECGAPLALSVLPRWWERPSVRIGGAMAVLVAVAITAWRIAHSRQQRRLAYLEQQHLLQKEREQSRLILEKSEERYRTLFECSRNGIIFADIHTYRFKYANPAAAQMLGYTEAELCSLSVENVCSPEVLDEVYRRLEAQQQGERVDAFDLPCVRKDGSVCYVELSSSVLTTSEGTYSIAFFNDVTQRKKAVDALRNSEQLARLLLNATTDITHLIDEDGTILDLNDAMTARLGATREELIGQCVFDMLPRDVGDDRRRRFRQAVVDGKPLRYIDRVRPDVVYDVGFYPIATPAGEKRRFVVFAHDITDRENALQSLQASQGRLQLLAGKLLTAQEEERRRLAREMHDDLTQRLALLALEASYLEHASPAQDSPLRARVQDMRANIVTLSKDVHDLSRQIHPAIVDDLGLVHALKSECIAFTDREAIPVKYEAKDVPASLSKRVAICLFRIAQESLRNIAKHARADEASVSLSQLDGELTLTIRDNGIGCDMVREACARGIGLTSMTERARLIEAEFSVQSEPGKGTVIRVVVPCSMEQE